MTQAGYEIDPVSVERTELALSEVTAELTATARVSALKNAAIVATAINAAFAEGHAPQAHRFRGAAHPSTGPAGAEVRVVGTGGFTDGASVLHAVNYGSRLKRFHTPPNRGGVIVEPVARRMQPVVAAAVSRDLDSVIAVANRKA